MKFASTKCWFSPSALVLTVGIFPLRFNYVQFIQVLYYTIHKVQFAPTSVLHHIAHHVSDWRYDSHYYDEGNRKNRCLNFTLLWRMSSPRTDTSFLSQRFFLIKVIPTSNRVPNTSEGERENFKAKSWTEAFHHIRRVCCFVRFVVRGFSCTVQLRKGIIIM